MSGLIRVLDKGRKNSPGKDVLYEYLRHWLHLKEISAHFKKVCMQAHRQQGEDRGAHRHSDDCMAIISNTWNDISSVDGHWNDESSQLAFYTVHGSPKVVVDKYVSDGTRKNKKISLRTGVQKLEADPEASLFYPANGADLSSRLNATGPANVGIGEVHFMMVPWWQEGNENSKRPKFKIMGLNSC